MGTSNPDLSLAYFSGEKVPRPTLSLRPGMTLGGKGPALWGVISLARGSIPKRMESTGERRCSRGDLDRIRKRAKLEEHAGEQRID